MEVETSRREIAVNAVYPAGIFSFCFEIIQVRHLFASAIAAITVLGHEPQSSFSYSRLGALLIRDKTRAKRFALLTPEVTHDVVAFSRMLDRISNKSV